MIVDGGRAVDHVRCGCPIPVRSTIDLLSIVPYGHGETLLRKESTMSEVLNGLPSQMGIQSFLSDYAIRSGLLDHYGWGEEAQKALVKEVGRLIDKGIITVEPDPLKKAIVTNQGTKLTAMFRVCFEPKPIRHGARGKGFIPAVVEEMEFFNNTMWHLNPVMIHMLLSAKTNHVNEMIVKVPNFLDAAKEVGCGGFYTPVFYDRVLRSYHEGIFSPTGSKMVRACLDLESIAYSVTQARMILTLAGVDWRQADVFLSDWEANVKTESDFYTLRLYLFLKEVEEAGESGFSGNGDITLSGPLLGGVASSDKSLMLDTNIGSEDLRDCRETVGRRIVVPEVLAPWETFIRSKSAAKPLITRLYYGESGKAGADGMFWDDPKNAPLGWRSVHGVVDENITIKGTKKWNSDYAPMIHSLGPAQALRAFRCVSDSYNSTFWNSYPRVRELMQRLGKAFDAAKELGVDPYFVAPHGAVYTHHKWELDFETPTKWRFRYKSPALKESWPHGFECTLQNMKDTAGAHSIFVRIIHFLDAWFKNRVILKLKKLQMKKYGKVMGGAAIHDCFITHGIFLLDLHNIVRGVLHEALEVVPKAIDEFLVRYGQEPMPRMSKEELTQVHRYISKNRGFLKMS